VKLVRSALVVVLLGFSASVVLADGVDPLVGIKSGGGSTPITITDPNPTVTATAGTTGCTIAGDTCVVDVFQNQTGSTLTNLTIFITTTLVGGNPLNFTCNDAETEFFGIFGSCVATAVAGGTDLFFSGGTGVAPATFECPEEVEGCFFVGGEFAVDIEGTITDGQPPDLPSGTSITTQVITSPEPGSALMLLFGAAAFALTKVARRAA